MGGDTRYDGRVWWEWGTDAIASVLWVASRAQAGGGWRSGICHRRSDRLLESVRLQVFLVIVTVFFIVTRPHHLSRLYRCVMMTSIWLRNSKS